MSELVLLVFNVCNSFPLANAQGVHPNELNVQCVTKIDGISYGLREVWHFFCRKRSFSLELNFTLFGEHDLFCLAPDVA